MLNILRHIKYWLRQSCTNLLFKWGEKYIVIKTKGTVISGIFTGTKLINKEVFGSKAPKLLGCYEKELHSYFKSALDRKLSLVCNIGGAEGYYSVGLARHNNIKKVIVFESLQTGRELIKENSELNDVSSKIIIKGKCDEPALLNFLSNNHVDLMLIDIEGAELDILSHDNVQYLSNTDLLIESHDFCRADCLEILISLFEATHNLTIYESNIRTYNDFTLQSYLPNFLKLALVDEMRPESMSWLACTPKHSKLTL